MIDVRTLINNLERKGPETVQVELAIGGFSDNELPLVQLWLSQKSAAQIRRYRLVSIVAASISSLGAGISAFSTIMSLIK